MKKDVEIKINKKKVRKKIEEAAKRKYSTINASSEHSDDNLPNSLSLKLHDSENSVFIPTNTNSFFNQPKEKLPFGYRKIKCQHCEKIITVPMGYSHCTECGKTVYVDKNTVSLM